MPKNRSVWIRLVNASGAAFEGSRIGVVCISSKSYVAELCDAIQQQYANSYLQGIASLQLYVFEHVADVTIDLPLAADTIIGKRARKASEALKVRVPKRAKTLDRFELGALAPLPVEASEYQLDSFAEILSAETPVIATETMHSFWEGYGRFPLQFFVRLETCMLWKVIKKMVPYNFVNRLVIVGSPGVGKLCLLSLIALCLACVEKKPVLFVRCMKHASMENAVVYLDGNGSFARARDVDRSRLHLIHKQCGGALILVDGYSQSDLMPLEVPPFHILATSSQYDAKPDDSAKLVVLPAWYPDDLVWLACVTSWDVGSHEILHSTREKLAWKHYFFSGGSARDFHRTRDELRDDVDALSGVDTGYELIKGFGGERSEDRVRRQYVTDRTIEEHYFHRSHWRLVVDSGYALTKLCQVVTTQDLISLYCYARAIDAGFLPVVYKLLFHRTIREANHPVVVTLEEGSYYERLETRVRDIECAGATEAECFMHLRHLGDSTYWYPDYPFFPLIDAVVRCSAFRPGCHEPDSVLAYIRVTTSARTAFSHSCLEQLDAEIDQNPSLRGLATRLFVVVRPDLNTFEMENAPDPTTIRLVTGCFDPEQIAGH